MDEQISQEGFPTLDSMKPQQQTLFDLEELTVRNADTVDSLKKRLKETKLMVKEFYLNNPEYKQKHDAASEVKTSLQQVAERIGQIPEIATVLQTMKDVQTELKEKKVAISDYILEYKRLSGNNQIEKDGVLYDIVETARLVKRSQ